MMQVVKNHKRIYTSGDSTWSRGRSFDASSDYKIPRKRVKFDR